MKRTDWIPDFIDLGAFRQPPEAVAEYEAAVQKVLDKMAEDGRKTLGEGGGKYGLARDVLATGAGTVKTWVDGGEVRQSVVNLARPRR